jgi:hypothetical protein
MGRCGRRCKHLVDALKKIRGCWKLKVGALYSHYGQLALEEALDISLDRLGINEAWLRTGIGGGLLWKR